MNPKSAGTADGDLGLIPLSRAQYGMWFADSMPGGPPVNIAQYVEIEGPIDADVFAQAVTRATQETESLVVRVIEFDGRPYQFVDRSITFDEPVLDVSDEDDPFAAAMEWMRRDYHTKAVDMSRDRLTATRLIRLGEDRYLWYGRAHHLVIDGYGAFNAITRIAEHYNAILETGRPHGWWRPSCATSSRRSTLIAPARGSRTTRHTGSTRLPTFRRRRVCPVAPHGGAQTTA